MRHTTRSPLAGPVAGLTVLALLGAATVALAAPSDADPAPSAAERAVAKGLLSPLSLAVAENGTVYYSQNFAGSLHAQRPGRKARTIFTAKTPGDEVGAVLRARRRGHLRDDQRHRPDRRPAALREGPGPHARRPRRVRAQAEPRPRRDLRHPRPGHPECAAQFPAEGLPATYGGIVESHPYATATTRRAVYVADAAANAVFRVRGRKVTTVAVLPPVPVKITSTVASSMGLPACAVGRTYHFESVPTDVEVARNGDLYVSTLPGGPEDGTMAGHAAVYRIDPDAKLPRARKVAGGLTSATGLAVSLDGQRVRRPGCSPARSSRSRRARSGHVRSARR